MPSNKNTFFEKFYKLSPFLYLSILLGVGFIYRTIGLNQNVSFWSDEEHVAIFVRAILERGKPVLLNGYSTGFFQILQYWLGALSSVFFGFNEFALRFPSVIFGVLTILATYLLGREIINKKVGLVASTFLTFLTIEILWSRQARPYQALQLLFVLGAYFTVKLLYEKKFNLRYFITIITIGIIAILFHGLGIVYFIIFIFNLILLKPFWFRVKWLVVGSLIFIPLIFLSFGSHILFIINNVGKINNLYYYRIFLWNNYSLLSLLSIIGALNLFWKKNKVLLLISSNIIIILFVVSFFLNQPFTRYLYIIFPFLIILASQGLYSPIKIIKIPTFVSTLLIIIIVVCIVGINKKFSPIPKINYPLNEDMQEIPQVNWKELYSIVGNKLENNPKAILISNWTDLPIWFLGENSLDYLIRKGTQGDRLSGAKILNSLNSLKKIQEENPLGVLVIDSWDNYVPDGVREYAAENLKKEFEVDRLYPVQPRYWTVWVYSWGIE